MPTDGRNGITPGARSSLCEFPVREAIHTWFSLTYANYLVLPRSVLQSMPDEWQARFVAALAELDEAFGHLDYPTYDVRCLARNPEFVQFTVCPECEGEGVIEDGSDCPTCNGEGETDVEPRYETAEEVGFITDPIPHYNRGRTRLEPRATASDLFRPTVICRHCGHTEECHGFNEDPTLPRLCDVEVSDWGNLDCSCPGFEAA